MCGQPLGFDREFYALDALRYAHRDCPKRNSGTPLSPNASKPKTKAGITNMFTRMKKFFAVALCMLLIAVVPMNATTVTSSAATIAISFNQSEYLTVTASVPLTIPSTGGESNVETITVGGLLASGHPTVDVVAYFSSASALTGTAGTVTASNVQLYQGGTPTGAFTGTFDGQSNAFLLSQVYTFNTSSGPVNMSIPFGVGISPAGMAGLLPGAVAGTLNVFAQAN